MRRFFILAFCIVVVVALTLGSVLARWDQQESQAVAIPTAHPPAASPPVAPSPTTLQQGALDKTDSSALEPRPSLPPPGPSDGKPHSISLVGALQLDPFNRGVHGDVAGYKNLAFVGKGRGACPGTGVDIIDISNPARPVKIADTDDYANTAMEDMEALQIGTRDVLAIGLQQCGNAAVQGTKGLELVDITDPRRPQRISLFPTRAGGVHELDLARTPQGKVLALLAVPDLEALTADPAGRGGTGDLLVVEITDPAHPKQVAEWGILDEPALGRSLYTQAQQGSDARTLLHSVRANANGTRAYLSYWDAGVIMLDISDPAHPVYRGRTSFVPGEEGNAHSVAEAQNGTILVQADEDFSPFGSIITSTVFTGRRDAVEADFARRIVDLPGQQMGGEVVHVGRGCPAGSQAQPPTAEDAYLADPRGKIALIERGVCQFDYKVARAQQAGAVGVIVYNAAESDEALIPMGGAGTVSMPGGTTVAITIPAVFVARNTGLALRDSPSPVTARVAVEFNGWGYLRLFDIRDPAHPVRLGTFATPNTMNEASATRGTWSVHNPEVRGTTVFASWYNDGVHVVDISDPSKPYEIARWTGAGAPANAPRVEIWSVVPHGDLLLASDLNFGLYVLKLQSR